MIDVTLYTRKDCHLCDEAQAALEGLQSEVPHRLLVLDIDSDAKLLKQYGLEVPVVEVGPYRLKAPIERKDLLITLKAVALRGEQDEAIRQKIQQSQPVLSEKWSGADRFTHWMSHHYLAFLNLLVIFYLGLPLLAPVLMKAGATVPASAIYRAYSFLCHQLPYRSWFLFGEQTIYPRASAGIAGTLTFTEATGLPDGSSDEEIWNARQFVGNEAMGYKIALCQRDVAIYGGILIFGVVFAISGRRIPSLPTILWLLAGVLPIALDGGSQLLSQVIPALNGLIPWRESTPYLRTLTGGLFGLLSAWFGYPLIEESMRFSRQVMEEKRQRISKDAHALPPAG